jgi:tRNA(Ile)-lysidine synthase TilS/MesJ
LDSDIKRCSRCILPSTLSSVTFDDEGVCNHCRKYEEDFKEWELIKDRKEKEFKAILDKAKSLGRPYDCLVPLSGGKDSTYALYLCTKVYRLRTLAVTFDNGYLSGLARENIGNALRSCNADHVFYKINIKNSSELFREFTIKTGDFCNACMRGINYSIEFAARNFRIPLIIKGSGRRVQYVSQIKEVSGLNTAAYFSNVIRGSEIRSSFSHFARYKRRLEFQKITGGILDIFGIRRSRLMRFIPQHIGMYDYIYKPYPEIIDIIRKEMRWNDFSGSVEHLDCELHDIPFYKDTLRIHGITGKTFHRSGLIRQGLLTREEALRQEEEDLKRTNPPAGLLKFLSDNELSIEKYIRFVKETDRSMYESKIQKAARDIYHRFRKF